MAAEESNIINGNMKVANLVERVKEEIERLKDGSINPRTMRQLTDADNFLKMIRNPPYSRAVTVSELNKVISEKRAEIENLLAKADPFTAGHQFTFDDLNLKPVSEETKKELEKDKKEWEKERHWLHKCLGICKNKNYFK